jgi:uncharacterized protein (TIGR02611 family)
VSEKVTEGTTSEASGSDGPSHPGHDPQGRHHDVPQVRTPELDYGPMWLRRLHARAHANPVTSLVTKLAVTCVGVLVIVAGLVMMVAPGPGIVAIILGLAILSTEWEWADRWVDRLRAYAHEAAQKARNMDPAVRRRRIALGTLAVVVVVGAVVGYVATYDWPSLAVDGWDWVQGLAPVVPDLPGM